MGSTLVYTCRGESSKFVDPSRVHPPHGVYTSLEGLQCIFGARPAFKDSEHGVYACVERLRRIFAQCSPFKDSPHGVYTNLD